MTDRNNNCRNGLSVAKEKLIDAIKRIQHELDECREEECEMYIQSVGVENCFDVLEREVRSEFQNLHRFLDEEESLDLERLRKARQKQVKQLRGRERKIAEQGKDLERAVMTLNSKLAEEDSPKLLKEIKDLIKRSMVSFVPPREVETEVRAGQFVGPIQYRIWKHMKSCLYPNITAVTFDPDTAHPLLTVSPSRASMWYEEDKDVAGCPANPRRFHYYYCVFGQQSFSAGRHYWEVEVGRKTSWRLGVARDDVPRGEMAHSGTLSGIWTLALKSGTLVACTDPEPTGIVLSSHLLRIGVFLDCEQRELSFYNAGSMAPLYTFSLGTVAAPLVPFFNPCDSDDGRNTAPLAIFSPSL
ncbi:unnamed protein product [Gadus morhua 'NCC']